jgi:hypothetical protein
VGVSLPSLCTSKEPSVRSTLPPKRWNTSTCGSISRTPSVQPLTLSSRRATPKRASSGGTSMIEERISSGSRCSEAFEHRLAVMQLERARLVVHLHVAAERAEDVEICARR